MKFTIWQDKAGAWRWTLRARNGLIIADSAQGYASRRSVVAMCRRINFVFQIVEA
jgi:uncharacterized protein YegP (UPF0339 family)